MKEEEDYLRTADPYYTLQNEVLAATETAELLTEKPSELPAYRIVNISPSYIIEGTEDVDDETFLKRHQKPETDEKRRKRWDVQRLREQRQNARLRSRFDPQEASKIRPEGAEAKETSEKNLRSLLPTAIEATHIQVGDTFPVSAFGYVLPNLPTSDFSLPWLAKK